jgi:hypothetical protein
MARWRIRATVDDRPGHPEYDGGVVTVPPPLDPREAPVARPGVDSTSGPG